MEVTRVKSKEGEEKKYALKFNIKLNSRKIYAAKYVDRDVPELLRGVEFSVAKN